MLPVTKVTVTVVIAFLGVGLLVLGGTGCSDSDETVGSQSKVIRVPGRVADLATALAEAKVDDTILLADGLYRGEGFRDLDFFAKSVALMSENGPEGCVIDLEGSDEERHYGFSFPTGVYEVLVQGITIRGGYYSQGTALHCSGGELTFRDMVLINNYATISGGAIRCKGTAPLFENCTVVRNECAMAGGGVFLIANAAARFVNCIVAFNQGGGAFYVSDNGSTPALTCCNVYGNAEGDWTEDIASQAGQEGNVSVDPKFCAHLSGDVSLRGDSPCRSGTGECGLVGALGVGCDL